MVTHMHSWYLDKTCFFSISVDVDWNAIREKKQLSINKSNARENPKQIPHTYRKGDYITLKKPGILQKLVIPREGPYKVTKHNNNGSILIEKAPTKSRM